MRTGRWEVNTVNEADRQRRDVPRAQEWIDQCETLISRRGHRIAFRRRGQGSTVFMLHGFPTWSYDYAELAGDLASDHEVITVDFLGYGASDKPHPYEYSVAESADVVEDLATRLQLTSVRLVVHDYGGIVSQELIYRPLPGTPDFPTATIPPFNFPILFTPTRPTH